MAGEGESVLSVAKLVQACGGGAGKGGGEKGCKEGAVKQQSHVINIDCGLNSYATIYLIFAIYSVGATG